MNILQQLITNKAFISGAAGWFTAQLVKIIGEMITGNFSIERVSGAGGMPSTHSATMSALTTAVFICEGAGSSAFAIALFVSFIVMYDGMSVRYVTGQQSRILNKITNGKKLPEKMGHTLAETIAGCAVGIVVACIVCLVILR